jgi:hypothetical protein
MTKISVQTRPTGSDVLVDGVKVATFYQRAALNVFLEQFPQNMIEPRPDPGPRKLFGRWC